MTRKTFVYRDGQMVPKDEARRVGSDAPLIMGDLPDFVSPIDKSVINGRAGMREHFRRHGVTNMSDYKETWDKQRRERERFFTQGPDRGVREALIRAFNDQRR